MRIAVVGAGISGLVAADRLARRHEVTLYEANDYPGGHTNTVDVELDGRTFPVDTGFIVFNDWTYPHFIALLDELGVKSQPTSMGFSVRCDRTGLEYNGSSLNGLFSQRANLLRPSFWRMTADILRFNRCAAIEVLETNATATDETTVEQFLRDGDYSREFAEHYLLPMGAAVWSCPTGTFAQFPIRFIVDFYRNHGLLNLLERPQWRVVAGGACCVCASAARSISRSLTSEHADRPRRAATKASKSFRCRKRRSISITSCSPVTRIRPCGCWPTRRRRNATC
ncbi:MAG: FAD-dependent oxidoreductase [Pirellulales bacterium]